MKKLSILSAILTVLTLKAMASGPYPILNISCTAQFDKTNYIKGSQNIATTTTESINNRLIYNVISNAVSSLTNGLATHLPANGYIAYEPWQNDGNVTGYFFVTNKTGFYFPLSGYDSNNHYYSFMEVDSYDSFAQEIGFANMGNDDINNAASFNINWIKGGGSVKDTETGLLYIHSNPNDFDDLDNPGMYNADNQDAMEIRGIFVFSQSGANISFSITGSGNINMVDINGVLNQGVITSGKATLK